MSGLRSSSLIAVIAAVAACAMSLPARAGYVITSFDVPGATETSAYGINNAGTVVGYYADETGAYRGFSRTAAGVYTILHCPGAANTLASAINNVGTIVGTGTDADYNALDGFSFSGGTYTSLNGNPTWPNGINDAGTIVGDAIYSPGMEIDACGINNAGVIVGIYIDDSGIHGHSLTGTTYTLLDYPGAIMTNAYGINNHGDIVGTYVAYVDDSYLQHGFVLSGGAYSTLNLDSFGDSGAFARGINDGGMISGTYRDAEGLSHGFLATPIPEPAPVPEPVTILGVFAGCAGLGSYLRKRRLA